MTEGEKFRNYSNAAESNKKYILSELRKLFKYPGLVLEIGSGSGQHAVYFAENLNHLTWQPTDTGEYAPALQMNIKEMSGVNVRTPLTLDVADETWPVNNVDYVYCANALHIMSTDHGKNLIEGVGRILNVGGVLVLYGPYKQEGEYTTKSNADFDLWLKDRNEQSGLRDVEWIRQLASHAGMAFLLNIPMPANNQLLVLQKE